MKLISPFLLFGILYISGCSPEISSLSWMAGTWEMPKPNGHVRLEIWQKENERGLRGKGVSVAHGDTTGLETITLYKDQHHIWYVPVVSDQNEGQPVPFKLVSDSDRHFVFENPAHDFPQRIAYHFKPLDLKKPYARTTGDSMVVDVTSMTGDGIQFRFYRK